MPGFGRGGIMPGLGRGPPGRGGRLPALPGCRGAAGRGAGALPPTPNGLLPTRGPGRAPGAAGVAGRGAAGAGAAGAGADAAGATGALGAAGAGAGAAGASGAGAAGAGAAGWTAGAAGAASTGAAGAGAAAAFFAGAFLAGAGAASGNASRSLRATGASTVDEAVFTYSPIWVSFSIASLLVSPSSLASADTRVLPGTCLLCKDRAAAARSRSRRWTCSSLALHRVPIGSSSPAGFRWLVCIRIDRCHVLAHRRRVQRPGHTQCPGEGPAPNREFGTSLDGMQPGTSSGDAPPQVGYHRQGNRPTAESWTRALGRTLTGRPRRHDDADQLGSRCPLPAPDARSDRAVGPRSTRIGCRRRSDGHR